MGVSNMQWVRCESRSLMQVHTSGGTVPMDGCDYAYHGLWRGDGRGRWSLVMDSLPDSVCLWRVLMRPCGTDSDSR